MVVRTFQIKRDPEHLRLQDYINDNANALCPIVGLEYITEFLKESEQSARPYYHCYLGGCCNEQGDSRQMFEHLVSLSQGGGDLRGKLIFGDPHTAECIDSQNIFTTLPGREPAL